jgi:hypothetical protein
MKVLVLALAVLTGCTGTSATGSPIPDESDPHPPASSPRVATGAPATPAPSVAFGPAAADLLECDGPMSDVGGAGEDVSLQVAGGDTPDEALEAFLATSPWVVPTTGYEPIASAGDRHAFGLLVDDEVKVIVVVSPRFADRIGAAFAADEVRTCPSGEFGSEAEFADGRRTWMHADTGHVITDIAGPGHCDWQTARLMHLEHPDGSLDRQYVRDPAGVLPAWPLLDSYAEGIELPDEATDSGYRSPEGFELWFTERDTAAYVVTPDGIERWPRAVEPIGCA